MMSNKFAGLIVLIIFGVVSRLIPHPPNFTPVLAIGLFAGFAYPRIYSPMILLLIMLISDLFLGFSLITPVVYASITLCSFIGWKVKGAKSMLIGSLIGAIMFFIVTNFAVWCIGPYPYSLIGLIECYVMAVPFFANTLCSCLLYSGILFSLYAIKPEWYFKRNHDQINKKHFICNN